MQEKLANSTETQNTFTGWIEKGYKLFTVHENIHSKKKILVNYYKMHHFLIKSWHGFLGSRRSKLINLKFICWHSAIEKIEKQRQRQTQRKRIRALSEQ